MGSIREPKGKVHSTWEEPLGEGPEDGAVGQEVESWRRRQRWFTAHHVLKSWFRAQDVGDCPCS